MNPRHMLLFYGVLFYGIHMVISAFCNRKILRQQYENISFHSCKSQVELTLLLCGSPGMRTAACLWLNEEHYYSICLKWLKLLCQLLTTVRSMHRCVHAHLPTHANMQVHTQSAHGEKPTAFSIALISCLIVCQFSYLSPGLGHMALLWSGDCVYFWMCVYFDARAKAQRLHRGKG